MKRCLLVLLAACGSNEHREAGPPDVLIQMDAPAFSMTCTYACTTTALTAAFQVTRVLDHAYFGITAADNSLHVEAYKGGATGCPTMNSPTPEYTLVVGHVIRPTSAMTSTSTASILDYQGDLLGGPLGAQAMSVTLTPVAASGDMFIAFDVMMTFSGGTVMGHLYATHCTSLDG